MAGLLTVWLLIRSATEYNSVFGKHLVALGSSWQLWAVPGIFGQLWVALSSSRQFWVALVSSGKLLAALDSSW